MSINEIEILIKELVEAEAITDKDRKSLSSRIKRSYNIEKQELKSKGKSFSFESLNRLITILINNYEKIKDNDIINEVMQEIAEDYSEIMPTNRINQEDIERQKTRIYQHILGNPGTKTDGMTSEFIASIIRLKLTENDGINREDILNILAMQSKNMYQDIEEYQKLINDTIIAYFTYNPNGQNFTNPKVLKIFENLAASYKIAEDFDRVKEIYEQALKMKFLEDTPEYAELQKHYKDFLDFMISRVNAQEGKYMTVEDFMNSLNTTIAEQGVFVKGTRADSDEPKPSPNKSYIMPVEDRVRAIEILLYRLKEKNPEFDIIEKVVFPDDGGTFSNYVQIKIKGTDVSFLENFVLDNPRVFVLKNECIDQIKPLSKWGALKVEGVEGINHIENFENYCNNLFEAIMKLIRETSPAQVQEKEEIRFENNNQPNIPVVPTIPIGIDVIEEDFDSEKNVEEKKEDSNSEEIEDDIEEVEKQHIEEAKPSDPVEAERQKAYRFQAHLRELEAEIERIPREAEENINKIKEQKANIESGEEHK